MASPADTGGIQRNPLLPPPAPAEPTVEPPVESSPLLGQAVAVERGPQTPVGASPAAGAPAGLGFAPVGVDADVWIVGLHGGCGATTVRALLGEGGELRGRWPRPDRVGMPVPRVLLVARTHAFGLAAAAGAASQWAAGGTGVLLVGLVLVDDAPTVPKQLVTEAGRLAGMVPALWHLPWLEACRLSTGPPAVDQLGRRVRKTVGSLRERIEQGRAAGTLQNLTADTRPHSRGNGAVARVGKRMWPTGPQQRARNGETA